MSNGYKNAMDKFSLSDSVKNKIVQNAVSDTAKDGSGYKRAMDRLSLSETEKQQIIKKTIMHQKQRIRRSRIGRYAANIAAGLILCLVSVPLMKQLGRPSFDNDMYIPEVSRSPEVPDSDKPSYTGEADAADKRDSSSKNGMNEEEKEQAVRSPAAAEAVPGQKDKKDKNSEAVRPPQSAAGRTPRPSAAAEHGEEKHGSTEPGESKAPPQSTAGRTPRPSGDAEPGKEKPVNTEPAANTAAPPDNNADDNPIVLAPAGSMEPSETDGPDKNDDADMFRDFDSIEALEEHLGYSFDTPRYLPEGYSEEHILLCFGRLIEMTYTNAENHMTYRTERSFEDVSGDYNKYEAVDTVDINGREAVIKTDKDIGTLMTWADDTSSYSFSAEIVLDKNEAVKIIENTARKGYAEIKHEQ